MCQTFTTYGGHCQQSIRRTPTDTRKAAHIDAAARKQALHDMILDALGQDMFTADEMAAEIGEDVLSVRPRMTELFRKGKIVKTPLRRQNKSGKKAIVWAKGGTA